MGSFVLTIHGKIFYLISYKRKNPISGFILFIVE